MKRTNELIRITEIKIQNLESLCIQEKEDSNEIEKKTKKKQNISGRTTNIQEQREGTERHKDESGEVETVGDKKEGSNEKM